ncbi:ribosome maturation factor RimP [Flavobacterium granuli]|uniref:Ribosome maturation factor RimP n=2 Tax=Flavobacterium granuli TaxID=280093 RepID=A0A1M5MNI0_9FLAO|nr:ribosome maturation factor RimP [Flavobacterium granuli]SHG78592.1 ribosome maturation factor RimP [Flavobacterium granuli]
MRGLNVPSFYKIMVFKEKVNKLLSEALSERPSLFLIDVTITDAFKVIVTLDDDNGVVLQDCIDVSRAIESNLDREEQDFSLEVASVGVGSPLKIVRQYKKNIGRTLIVTTNTEKIEAELVDANEDFIILSWKAREPKKVGKGKETVQKEQQIPYTEIKEAIVTVTF